MAALKGVESGDTQAACQLVKGCKKQRKYEQGRLGPVAEGREMSLKKGPGATPGMFPAKKEGTSLFFLKESETPCCLS